MQLRLAGVESFHADRRLDGHTDMTKVIVTSCNLANALKNATNIFK
jgi:hypothetical protein